MLRKILVLSLCIIIMLSAGCKEETQPDVGRPSSTPVQIAQTYEKDKLVQLPMILGSNYDKKPDEAYLASWVNYFKENHNIELKVMDSYDRFKYFDGTYMKSVLEYDIAKGLVYFPSTAALALYDLADSGAIIPMTSVLENNTAWNNLPEAMRSMYSFDGEVWAIPTGLTYSVYTRFINKDWLKQVGMAPPATTDELFAMCKAFTYGDPDGDGKNDTAGTDLSPGNVADIFGAFGLRLQPVNSMRYFSHIAYYDDSGKFEDCMSKDGINDLLGYIRSMVVEGIAYSSEKPVTGTYARFLEPFTHDCSTGIRDWWEFLLTSSAEHSEIAESKYTEYEYVFSLNGVKSNPIICNYSGGFYVADNHMENASECVAKFVDVFMNEKETYNIAAMGVDYKDKGATYTNSSMTENNLPPLLGRIPDLYDPVRDDISGVYGEETEKARQEYAAMLREVVDAGLGYMLMPRIGFGVPEGSSSYSFFYGGTELTGSRDAIHQNFSMIFYGTTYPDDNISISDYIDLYHKEAAKSGTAEFIETLNEMIGR